MVLADFPPETPRSAPRALSQRRAGELRLLPGKQLPTCHPWLPADAILERDRNIPVVNKPGSAEPAPGREFQGVYWAGEAGCAGESHKPHAALSWWELSRSPSCASHSWIC